MSSRFYLRVILPDSCFGEFPKCRMVLVQTSSGEVGIMADHTDIISDIKKSTISVFTDGGKDPERIHVGDGYFRMEENVLTIAVKEASRHD